MRVPAIVIAAIVIVLSFGLVIKTNQSRATLQVELEQERYARMIAEESLAAAQGELRSLETAIRETEGFNEALKARLDKAAKIKDKMDRKIQELGQ